MAVDDTVAVLGAGGTMGFAMGRNLARAGIEVRAWNRTREKADPLREEGATVCDTPAEAVQGAGVVLTMLPDTAAVVSTFKQARPGLSKNAVWLQMSTIGEGGAERCIELASEAGVTFGDAPVFGTKRPAEEGKLGVLALGPESVRDRGQPVFEVVGQRPLWVGEAGAG